jgi:hypothetical protein
MQCSRSPSVRSASVATLTALVLSAAFTGAFAGTAYADTANKVTLCHATGSVKTPFVPVTVAASGVLDGHSKHDGDVIPAYTYNDKTGVHQVAAQNLNAAGMYELAHGCAVPPAPVVLPPAPGVLPPAPVVVVPPAPIVVVPPVVEVTLCHATGSATNPFVVITVAASGVLDGHSQHDGDVIPAYTYTDKTGVHQVPAQNVDAVGAYELAHGCTPPPAPGVVPPAPVVVVPPAPGVLLPVPGESSTAPDSLPPVTVPTLAVNTASPAIQPASPAIANAVAPAAVMRSAALPFTGDSTGLLAEFALALVVSGAGALTLGRRREVNFMG